MLLYCWERQPCKILPSRATSQTLTGVLDLGPLHQHMHEGCLLMHAASGGLNDEDEVYFLAKNMYFIDLKII